jgi:hypothetical protein
MLLLPWLRICSERLTAGEDSVGPRRLGLRVSPIVFRSRQRGAKPQAGARAWARRSAHSRSRSTSRHVRAYHRPRSHQSTHFLAGSGPEQSSPVSSRAPFATAARDFSSLSGRAARRARTCAKRCGNALIFWRRRPCNDVARGAHTFRNSALPSRHARRAHAPRGDAHARNTSRVLRASNTSAQLSPRSGPGTSLPKAPGGSGGGTVRRRPPGGGGREPRSDIGPGGDESR